VFGDDQLFIILELAHGGQDLESFEFASADQAVAAITQASIQLFPVFAGRRENHRESNKFFSLDERVSSACFVRS